MICMPIDRSLFEKNSAYTRNALVAASAIFKDADFRKPEYLVKIIKDGLERAENQRAKTKQKSDGTRSMDDWKKSINEMKKAEGYHVSSSRASGEHKAPKIEKGKADR